MVSNNEGKLHYLNEKALETGAAVWKHVVLYGPTSDNTGHRSSGMQAKKPVSSTKRLHSTPYPPTIFLQGCNLLSLSIARGDLSGER